MYAKLSVNFDTNQTVTYFLMVIGEEKRAKYAVAFSRLKLLVTFYCFLISSLAKKLRKCCKNDISINVSRAQKHISLLFCVGSDTKINKMTKMQMVLDEPP